VIRARLTILLFAPAQWLLIWLLRYWAVQPIHRQVKASVAGFAVATILLGTAFAQGRLYQTMTGISIPAQDNYFFATFIGQTLVSLGIIFRIALELRRKGY
jgi:hypothetical protein